MKKKSLQKALALAVAAVMSLGTLAGCGSSETTTESAAPAETTAESAAETTADAETTAATEAASTEAAAAEGGGMDTWEPFAENVTLQVPVYDRGLDGVPDVTNNYWTQWIQENFGDQWNITVEFVPITRNDAMTHPQLGEIECVQSPRARNISIRVKPSGRECP